MGKRILKIVGLVGALSLALGMGAAVGGGAVYAMTQADKLESLPFIPKLSDDPEPGIVLAAVVPDSPAAEAGLVRGDILLEVDGQAVNDLADLLRVVGEEPEAGDKLTLTVLHGDDERTLTATLGEQNGKPYLGVVPCGRVRAPEVVVIPPAGPGAMIVDVVPDSPADEAGLEVGDVIVAVDGQELGLDEKDEDEDDDEDEDWNTLADVIAAHAPGDTVTLEVSQPGEESRDVEVELGEHPEKEGVAYLGVHYQPFPPFHHFEFGPLGLGGPPFERRFLPALPIDEVEQGVIIRHVIEDSPAEAADLRERDVIAEIDGEPLESPQDLIDAIAAHKPGDQVTLTIHRPGEEEEEAEEKEKHEVEVTLAEHPDEDEESAAYLGVVIGGFVRRHLSWDGEGHHELEHLEQLDLDLGPLDEMDHDFEPPWDDMHFEFEIPFDDLHFHGVPRRFEYRWQPHYEFHLRPEPFSDEVNCCGESV
jgi:S1-C subfamily serine protease